MGNHHSSYRKKRNQSEGDNSKLFLPENLHRNSPKVTPNSGAQISTLGVSYLSTRRHTIASPESPQGATATNFGRYLSPKSRTLNINRRCSSSTAEKISNSASPPLGRRFSYMEHPHARLHSLGPSESAEPNYLHLSNAQINLIRKAWASARVKGSEEPGLTIFEHVFFLSPSIRALFGFEVDPNLYLERLKIHAKAFTEVLDDLMDHLDDDHLVKTEIKKIGCQHAHFRDDGFDINYWDNFSKAMIDCTVDWGRIADRSMETQIAWMQIVMYITATMKDGFHEEYKKIWRREIPRIGIHHPGRMERLHNVELPGEEREDKKHDTNDSVLKTEN